MERNALDFSHLQMYKKRWNINDGVFSSFLFKTLFFCILLLYFSLVQIYQIDHIEIPSENRLFHEKKNTNKSSCSVFDDSLPLVGIRCKWNFCVASTKHTPEFFSRFRWSFAWVFQRCVLIFPPVSERCESKFNKIWIFVFVQPCSWDN